MKSLPLILLATLQLAALSLALAEPPRAAVNARHQALLNEYCVKCHDTAKQEGMVRLDNLPFVIADIETAERWQKVLGALNAGEMPPADEKQPERMAKADFLDDLANAMVAARKSLGNQQGEITMRRLNRREYKNTLCELLDVEVSVSELPSDAGNGGFDTVGTNLFMSANQFEQYQALGARRWKKPPQIIEVPFLLTRRHADRTDRTLFIREKGTDDDIHQKRRRYNEGVKQNGIGPEFVLWVDWLEIERIPYADKPLPPGLAALNISLEDKSKALTADELRAALKRFAVEAFRGHEPSEGYVERLAALYESRLQAGDKHRVALKETLSVVLASPMFLYLAEPVAEEKQRPLTSLELASRLSYFLWSAPPDATLRELAVRNDLQQPEVLAAQVDRLLEDPRSEGFVEGFVYQWLGLDRLDFFQVNRDLHPRMDNSTKLAARQEIYATFRYALQNNTSMRDLLTADYAVINSVLAQYYGIPGVSGDAFRPVKLPPDSPRGGLLGMAAVHIMGGNGEITSPVDRGAWVLRKLLNDPPPPAPANIPAITRLAGQALTTSERLWQQFADRS